MLALRLVRGRVHALIAGIVCAVALLAAAPPPAHALDATALRARLSRAMLRSGLPFSGAYVRDLTTGTALYAHKENVARRRRPSRSSTRPRPRCCGTGRPRRSTRRSSATGTIDPENGVWRGDLYLKGAGDPTLGQDQIEAIAQAIASGTGIRRVDGSVLGDESVFDDLRGASPPASPSIATSTAS